MGDTDHTRHRRREPVDLDALPRTADGLIAPPDDVDIDALHAPRMGRPTPRPVRERIAALLLTTDASYRQIARTVGVSWHTVASVARELQETRGDELAQLRQAQKADWAREAWEAARVMTQAATEGARRLLERREKLSARDVRDLSVAAGVMIDKTALILGEAGAAVAGVGGGRDIADAVLAAWEAGREAGRQEATPRPVIDVSSIEDNSR